MELSLAPFEINVKIPSLWAAEPDPSFEKKSWKWPYRTWYMRFVSQAGLTDYMDEIYRALHDPPSHPVFIAKVIQLASK